MVFMCLCLCLQKVTYYGLHGKPSDWFTQEPSTVNIQQPTTWDYNKWRRRGLDGGALLSRVRNKWASLSLSQCCLFHCRQVGATCFSVVNSLVFASLFRLLVVDNANLTLGEMDQKNRKLSSGTHSFAWTTRTLNLGHFVNIMLPNIQTAKPPETASDT